MFSKRLAMFGIAVGLVLACSVSSASAFAIVSPMVTNAANQAGLDGAVVCIGTSVDRAAHGRRTTSNGRAVFERVPEGSWILTAWRSGFAVGQTNINVPASRTTLLPGIVLSATATATSDPCGSAPPAAAPPAAPPPPAAPADAGRAEGRPIHIVRMPPSNSNNNVDQAFTPGGQQAAAAAVANGFTFSASDPCKVTFVGKTTFVVHMFVLNDFAGEGVCVVTLFGGRALAPGWKFTALKWRTNAISGNCRITASPNMPAAQLHTQVFVAGRACQFTLETVELKGPAGMSWQDAFRR